MESSHAKRVLCVTGVTLKHIVPLGRAQLQHKEVVDGDHLEPIPMRIQILEDAQITYQVHYHLPVHLIICNAHESFMKAKLAAGLYFKRLKPQQKETLLTTLLKKYLTCQNPKGHQQRQFHS